MQKAVTMKKAQKTRIAQNGEEKIYELDKIR